MRHPRTLGQAEVVAFLSHLAVKEHVAASTQNQALSALLFLYRDVLNIDVPLTLDAVRAKRSKHISTVLTQNEVAAVLVHRAEPYLLMTQLLYGSGLRLMLLNITSWCTTVKVGMIERTINLSGGERSGPLHAVVSHQAI